MNHIIPLIITASAGTVAVWWMRALVVRTIRAFEGEVEGSRPVVCKGCGCVMFWTTAGGVGLCQECNPEAEDDEQ